MKRFVVSLGLALPSTVIAHPGHEHIGGQTHHLTEGVLTLGIVGVMLLGVYLYRQHVRGDAKNTKLEG